MGNEKITLLLAVLFCHSLTGYAREVVTLEQGYQGQPVIWGDWIVWRDIQPDSNNSSIYAKNITVEPIPEPIKLNDSNSAGPPAIDANMVVWADKRNGNWDIFSSDPNGANESPLYVAEGNQMDPVICGDNVAFISGEDTNQEIWIYSISQDMAEPISIATGYKWKPDISEDFVVWGNYQNENWDIYGYDINELNEFRITSELAYQRSVAVSGSTVVFEETISPSGNSSIGIYKINGTNEPELDYIHLPGVVDWLDIYGEILVWGEYGTSTGSNIHGYYLNSENPNEPNDFAVCTLPGWQYAPAIYESTIVFSGDDVDEGSPYFYNRDIYCVDINDVNISQGRGDVFEYKVANVINVDDFESYVSFGTSNPIYLTWQNDFDTGAWVELGFEPLPVHRGDQSMEYGYDSDYPDAEKYSENYRNYANAQNWEEADVKLLTLFFYGHPDNDANSTEQMYFGIQDSNGTESYSEVRYGDYGEDMNDIRLAEWTKWDMVLSDFNSVTLTDVRKIYIGFGDRLTQPVGGKGYVYFDDITLTEGRHGCLGLNGDESVDFIDIKLLFEHWLENDAPVDLNADNLINFKDFAILARCWSQ